MISELKMVNKNGWRYSEQTALNIHICVYVIILATTATKTNKSCVQQKAKTEALPMCVK